VLGGTLGFLATPGVARADDLGAIGAGAAVLFVLAIVVMVFLLLIIVALVAAVLGSKGSPRTAFRKKVAGCCLGLSLITPVGPTVLILLVTIDEPGPVLLPMLVMVFLAVILGAGPVWLSQRARRYQALNSGGERGRT